MSENFFLDRPNQSAPEELSLEQISLNADKDLSAVLDFSDFVRVSAIFAGSKFSKNGLFRALKERNPDPSKSPLLRSKVAHAERVASGLLREEFDWFFRHYVVLLCVGLENFLRAHIFVSELVESNSKGLDTSKAIKNFMPTADLKALKKRVDSLWKQKSDDRFDLLKNLASNAPGIYTRLLPQYVDYAWMDPSRYDHKKRELLISLARKRYEENLLVDEDFRVLSDLFFLRNSIVHNGAVAKEKLDFGSKTFCSGDLISLSANDVYFFTKCIRKYKYYFPNNFDF
jgi:hypothetical protein